MPLFLSRLSNKGYPFYLGQVYALTIMFGLFPPIGTSTAIYLAIALGVLSYEYLLRNGKFDFGVILALNVFSAMIVLSCMIAVFKGIIPEPAQVNYFISGAIISLTVYAAIRNDKKRFSAFTAGLTSTIVFVTILSFIDYALAKALHIEIFASMLEKCLGVAVSSTISEIRLSGTMANPNYFSIVLLVGFSLRLGSVKRKGDNFLQVLSISVLFLGIILASSRVVTFAMLFTFAIYMLLLIHAGRHTLFLKVCGHIVTLSVMILIFLYSSETLYRDIVRVPELLERYEAVIGNLTTLDQNRGDIWQGYMRNILDSVPGLFLGYGFANYFDVGLKPHNAYIRAIVDFGIIGTVLFISYFFRIAYRLGRLSLKYPDKHEYLSAFLLMVSLLVACLGNDYTDVRIFWIGVGTTVAAVKIRYTEDSKAASNYRKTYDYPFTGKEKCTHLK